jgi:hypothetical protein
VPGWLPGQKALNPGSILTPQLCDFTKLHSLSEPRSRIIVKHRKSFKMTHDDDFTAAASPGWTQTYSGKLFRETEAQKRSVAGPKSPQ